MNCALGTRLESSDKYQGVHLSMFGNDNRIRVFKSSSEKFTDEKWRGVDQLQWERIAGSKASTGDYSNGCK